MRLRLEPDDGPAVDIVAGHIAEPGGRPDVTVPLGQGALGPGLINAHDHLHRNHYPRLGTPPYPDAYAWGRDIHDRCADDIARARRLPRGDALRFGALKNLIGGVTTCVHHDPWFPELDAPFPLRVLATRVVHSLGFEANVQRAARGDERTRGLLLCMHLAEGTTPDAAAEVRRADAMGLLSDRLLAIHVVGADADGVRRLRAHRTAVVWCPSSNHFLFGRTAPPSLLHSGVDVLLGTDSLLTGDGTMLAELAVARGLGVLDDAALLDAVGRRAAMRLGVPVPSLDPGAPADLVLWRRPPLEAGATDVGLVLVAGQPRYGDAMFAGLVQRSGMAVESLVVGGAPKCVIAPLGTIAGRVVSANPACGRVLC